MKERTVYALGFFDGVHIGHQALLEACREMAALQSCSAGVITFASHPDELVLGQAPKLLNTLTDRNRLLQSYGNFDVVVLPFDEKMQKMPWQDFFCLLTKEYGAAGLVCGEDFRFGNRGEGTAELLKQACDAAGIGCRIVREQTVDGIRVSSTYIRGLLEQGEMVRANRFLAHPHILTGTVVAGNQLGRTIGIPTANLELPGQLVQPKFGVYACKTVIDGKQYLAVTNVGSRPTVNGQGITVEPWILDFEGDLYGKEITVEFHTFLRPEEKFENLVQLQEQIRRDAEKTRIFFDKK